MAFDWRYEGSLMLGLLPEVSHQTLYSPAISADHHHPEDIESSHSQIVVLELRSYAQTSYFLRDLHTQS